LCDRTASIVSGSLALVASETIFAYVGPKGSGKTHEGTRVVLEQLKLGRFVVAVIPTLSRRLISAEPQAH
jgi:hypothetical protein